MAYIAVLDVGKTNKKVLIYDHELHLREQVFASFPADESGPVHFERIAEQQTWFLEQLRSLTRRFDIRVISPTTHGATFVGVSEDGAPALPVIAYTTDPGDSFRRDFAERYGNSHDLYRQLSTPNLGALVCLGRGIAFARKHFPEPFRRVRSLLGLPQYFGLLLTGKAAAECTYTGCHTYLWDFKNRDWSFMVDRMGIRHLLPERVGRPGDVLGTVSSEIARRTGLGPDTIVTHGIHDSNASLLPFLIQEDAPFVLNSTGTWCVTMVPTDHTELTNEERAQNAFLNCDAFGNPVKTAIFMGGGEHDAWWEAIQKSAGASCFPAFDPNLCASVLADADAFIFPGIMPGSGPFPESQSRFHSKQHRVLLEEIPGGSPNPPVIKDAAKAYVVLNAALAIQTYEQLKGVGVRDGMPVYIEGGFRRNEVYCALLASLLPGSRILRTNFTEATALGAAMLGLAAMTGRELKTLRADFTIDAIPVECQPDPSIWQYRAAYLDRIQTS
jgi:L-fuculokinase